MVKVASACITKRLESNVEMLKKLLSQSKDKKENQKIFIILEKAHHYYTQCKASDRISKSLLKEIDDWLLAINNFNYIKKHHENLLYEESVK